MYCMVNDVCLQDFKQQWLLNREIIINGRQSLFVNAYKLSMCSEFFWNKFKYSKPTAPIKIYTFKTNQLETALVFAHTDNVTLNTDTLPNIIETSINYKIPKLLHHCNEFSKLAINISNFWYYWRAYSITKHKDKPECVNSFLANSFIELSKYPAFLEITFEELEEILKDNFLNVQNEIDLFSIVCKWVKHNISQRIGYSTALLQCLRLGKLSMDNINQVARHPIVMITRSKVCKKLLKDARIVILRSAYQMRVLDENKYLQKCRFPQECIIILGGGMFSANFKKMKIFNSRENSWQILSKQFSMPFGRMFFELLILNDCMHVIGGLCETFTATSSVLSFSFKTMQWHANVSMNENRFFFTSCVMDNCIYVFGGHRDGWESVNSCERMMHNLIKWQMIAPMLEKRSRATCSPTGGKILVCGGNSSRYYANHSHWVTTCEIYDPAINQWTYAHPLPVNLKGCYKLVECLSKLYLVCNYEVFQQDNNDGQWRSVFFHKMSEHQSFSVCSSENEIYRINDSMSDKWSPIESEWKPIMKPLFPPGWGHQSVVLKCKEYVKELLLLNTSP